MISVASDEIRQDIFNAYEGEAKASARLMIYAEKAAQEGYPGAARLFRSVAAASAVHARNNLRLLAPGEDTMTNLSRAVSVGNKMAQMMYENMIERAEGAGDSKAATVFTWMRDVETAHEALYMKMLDGEAAREGVDLLVCGRCGLIVEGEAPEVCPVCGKPASSFFGIG